MAPQDNFFFKGRNLFQLMLSWRKSISSDDVIDGCVAYRCLLSLLSVSILLFDSAQLIALVASGEVSVEHNTNESTLSIQLYYNDVDPANPIGIRAINYSESWLFLLLLQ